MSLVEKIILVVCIIYIIKYFVFNKGIKLNKIDDIIYLIVFNIYTLILFIIGIILVNLLKDTNTLIVAIKYTYIILLVISLLYNIFIKGIIFILHRISKSNREADKGYIVKFNLLSVAFYGIIIILC